VTIEVDPQTIFLGSRTGEEGPEDVQLGDILLAAGLKADDTTLQAYVILLPRGAERNLRLTGEVASVEGVMLQLVTRNGRQIILLTDSDTAYHALGQSSASLGDVDVGDTVTAGSELREGRLQAHTLVVWPEDPTRVAGRLEEIEGPNLRLQTRQGTVEVTTETGTLFLVPGIDQAAIDDLSVGDLVICTGVAEGDRHYRALVVSVRRAPQR
jgi:hypothetical protein